MLARHVDRLARRGHRGGVGGRRVVHVEADHRDRAEPGVGGRDRDVVAPDQLLAFRAVGTGRGHVRQPVVDGAGPHDALVLLESRALPTEEARLREVQVGQPGGDHEPDDLAVLARSDERRVVRRLAHDRGHARVRHVHDEHPGARRDPAGSGRGVPADHHDTVAHEQQLGGEHPVEGQRPDLDRFGAGDVVQDQGAVVDDPHQQRAVGLHHVGLVDAGLLDVRTGVAGCRFLRLPGRLRGLGRTCGVGHRVDTHVVPAVRRHAVDAVVDVPPQQLVARRRRPEVRVDEPEVVAVDGRPTIVAGSRAGRAERDARREGGAERADGGDGESGTGELVHAGTTDHWRDWFPGLRR